jgi:hypothetical protein
MRHLPALALIDPRVEVRIDIRLAPASLVDVEHVRHQTAGGRIFDVDFDQFIRRHDLAYASDVVAEEISEIFRTSAPRPVGKAGDIGSDHFVPHGPFGGFRAQSRPEIGQASMPPVRIPKG